MQETFSCPNIAYVSSASWAPSISLVCQQNYTTKADLLSAYSENKWASFLQLSLGSNLLDVSGENLDFIRENPVVVRSAASLLHPMGTSRN